MRVLILDSAYGEFLARRYAVDPDLAGLTYQEQWRRLMDAFFGTADSYSHYLRPLGIDAHEIVLNATPLQHAWAREHGVRQAGPRIPRLRSWDFPARILIAQVEEFAPDVLYLQDPHALPARLLRRLRGRRRLLAGQIASPLPAEALLREFDLLVSSLPNLVERFRSIGVAGEHLALAFDTRILERLRRSEGPFGAVFVGGLGRSLHARGNAVLAAAAERAPIDFWGYDVESWPADSAIRRRYHGPAWALEMYEILAAGHVSLNRHIDLAEDHANNMRLYETTGVGTLLLTDARSDLHRLFETGEEIVTYRDADDLAEKIAYYLDNAEERRRIARAGQERTLRDHTWEVRMRELTAILERHAR